MPINNIIVKYPLDLTGRSPDNLVNNESHVVPRERSRGFAVLYGAYFTKSIRIIHAATQKVLVPHTDFICIHLYEKAARATGQEVCAAVLLTNDALDGEFLVTYQVVGGEFSSNVSVIEELIAQLELDKRPIKWGDILGLPNAFNPSEHIHDVDDLYGFEYLVEALDRIRAAITLGDYYDHDEIRQRIENLKEYLEEQDAQIKKSLETHLKDAGNPHKTTKAQVGLGLVDNFATATQAQAEVGTDKQSFMTPFTTLASIEKNALVPLRAHIADKTNPHATTKAQVGLGNVDNFLTATQAQAQAGVDKQTFMTPFLTMASIAKNAIEPLNAHVSDKGNPHGTTKAQVGLGKVEDYPVATQAQVNAGTPGAYVTPDTLSVRLADFGGHYVTKTEVNYKGTTVSDISGKIPVVSASGNLPLARSISFATAGGTIEDTPAEIVFNKNIDVPDMTGHSDPRDKSPMVELTPEELIRIVKGAGRAYSYVLLETGEESIGLNAMEVAATRKELSGTRINKEKEERLTVKPFAINAVALATIAHLIDRIEALENK